MVINKAIYGELLEMIRVALGSIGDLKSSVHLLVKLDWTQEAINEFVDVLFGHMDALKDMADEFKDALDKLKD